MDPVNPNVEIFNQDAVSNAGYLYTTNTRLSSRLATGRSMDIILQTGCFTGRSVLDLGCGDGYYTIQFWDRGKPKSLIGVDAADRAIELANTNKQDRPIQFAVGDVHRLPYPDNSFELVLVQSILHHDDNPLGIIKEAFRLAPRILVHEPNGNNVGLKVIEKTSRYHREHNEKSYTSPQLTGWIKQAGGRIVHKRFAGFVPMFCPDWLARAMKVTERAVEHLPLVRALGCSVIVLVAERPIR